MYLRNEFWEILLKMVKLCNKRWISGDIWQVFKVFFFFSFGSGCFLVVFIFISPLEFLLCCHHPRLSWSQFIVTSSNFSCGVSKWEEERWVGALGGTWVTIRCWAPLGICDFQLSQEQIFGILVFLHDFHKSSRSWLGEVHLCGVNWPLWLLMTQMMFSSKKTFLEEDLITEPSSSPPPDCYHLLKVESGLKQNFSSEV